MRTEKRENNTIGTSDQKTKNKTINKYMMTQTGFIFNAKSCSKYTSGMMAQNVSLIIFFTFCLFVTYFQVVVVTHYNYPLVDLPCSCTILQS